MRTDRLLVKLPYLDLRFVDRAVRVFDYGLEHVQCGEIVPSGISVAVVFGKDVVALATLCYGQGLVCLVSTSFQTL